MDQGPKTYSRPSKPQDSIKPKIPQKGFEPSEKTVKLIQDLAGQVITIS